MTESPDRSVARTRHLDASGAPRFTNALAGAASPYLRQHAHNPVDWRPWGEAAFAEARARDVPVFLSAGYATCHWCHVMEEECFDDLEVARALNDGFVAIKLDREARPDLDRVYILATQMQQRHAGWPNSVWLDHEGRPFHTGTYFPKPQFIATLRALRGAWEERRDEITRVAMQFSQALSTAMSANDAGPAPEGLAARAAAALAAAANPREGGFSAATQFPQEGFVLFLLDDWRRGGADSSWLAARGALDAISAGAIHDHVGGGFHRYSVDVEWRTPHFEKMLYNQALLTRCFVEGFELCGDPAYARAAARCCDYVLRDMSAADGAFFAAEDADSAREDGEMEEGAFYAWPAADALAALGEEVAGAAPLNLAAAPTIEAGPVPFLDPASRPDFAALDKLLERMRVFRERRARPLRDEKIIAGWNGLMIRALAEAGVALERPDFIDAAHRAAQAVAARLDGPDGLRRISAAGAVEEDAQLEDYAWLGLGHVALWDATSDAAHLARAEALAEALLARFSRPDGRLAMSATPGPLGPVLEGEDGATPSGESSALELLALLKTRAPSPARRARAEALRGAILSAAAAQPSARADGLRAARLLSEGESGARRALGQGAARLRLRRRSDGIVGEVLPSEGWSLQAQGDARPISIETERSITWADPTRFTVAPSPRGLTLTLTLCGGDLCLAPETARFRFAG